MLSPFIEYNLKPGDTVPAETLENSNLLFNEVVEGGKDLIIVPDDVSFYSTYEYNNCGFHGYEFNFYDVEQTAMDKCIEDYRQKYLSMNPDNSDRFFPDSGMYMFYGLDSDVHYLNLQYSKEYHSMYGSISDD